MPLRQVSTLPHRTPTRKTSFLVSLPRHFVEWRGSSRVTDELIAAKLPAFLDVAARALRRGVGLLALLFLLVAAVGVDLHDVLQGYSCHSSRR